MAVGCANVKDVGDVDSGTMGGMEGGATLGWAEETRSEDPESACESFAFGRKVGTRESFSFACFIFLRGNVLRLFVCKHLATRKRIIFRVCGGRGMRTFLSRICDSRY